MRPVYGLHFDFLLDKMNALSYNLLFVVVEWRNEREIDLRIRWSEVEEEVEGETRWGDWEEVGGKDRGEIRKWGSGYAG